MMRKLVYAIAAAAAFACFGCGNVQPGGSGEAGLRIPFGKSYDYNDILVVRAVDGDTLKLENGERVRLTGIDTPEKHESAKLYRDARKSGKDVAVIQRMGVKASEFTRRLVEGKRVRLEFDVEKQDRYGRLLAYVYLKDGTFVNEEIVKQGYASPYTFPPNVRYAERLRSVYQEARENRRGLWGEE